MLLAGVVVLVVLAIVFFAGSHPRRGAVVIGLAVLALIGAGFSTRTSRPEV